MKLLSEREMIAKINVIISQMGLGPEFKVLKVRSASWGIIAYWQPHGADKSVNAFPFLAHKNGVIKEYGDVAHRHNLHPVRDQLQVIEAFVHEAETRIRQ